MKFTVDGTEYVFDLESLTMDEAEIIEDYARLSVPEFLAALKATRVRAIRAVVLIAKRRAGEEVLWADLGSLDLLTLAQDIVEANTVPAVAVPPVAGEGVAAVASPDAAPLAKLAKRAPRKRSSATAAAAG